MKLQQDKYRKARGGKSQLLDIKCARVGHHLFYYQKDGLGIKVVYKKESRPAYRVFVGAILKKAVPARIIK